MGVADLFSKRKAVEQGTVPELQSQVLPSKFRAQVVHIFVGAIGQWHEEDRYMPPGMIPQPVNDAWRSVYRTVCQEHGRFNLGREGDNPMGQCLEFLLNAETDAAIDLIEATLRYIDHELRKIDPYYYQQFSGVVPDVDGAITAFNIRCRENGVGYVYERGRIIPTSSTFVHTQIVEPALTLLHTEGFRGAQDEFLRAHANLRRGDYKGAILEAGKAFESVMKTVCTRKEWAYDPHKTTASGLVAILFEKSLVPPYLQEQFTSLRKLFESGVPTVRNKTGGHGQGPEPVNVPRELAEYAIHLAATNIVFLVKLLKGSQ